MISIPIKEIFKYIYFLFRLTPRSMMWLGAMAASGSRVRI